MEMCKASWISGTGAVHACCLEKGHAGYTHECTLAGCGARTTNAKAPAVRWWKAWKFTVEKFYVDDWSLAIGVGRDGSRMGRPWAVYARVGRFLLTFWPRYGGLVNTVVGARFA